jgi:1-acyl-sn-glycerol-3-phosphate acyltransferase
MSFKPDRPHALYRLVRLIIKGGLGIFFQRLEVRHPERLPATGPVVFVANHPNSIMDGMILWAVLDRKINYIAHAGLFRAGLMKWLLRNLGVIPVYRRQDDPDKMEQNVSMFRAAYEALEHGETIGIFPEGTSDMLRKVKQVKTGAARIVLETESRNGYDLGVKLIPLGLHFFSRSHFHSRVLINVGEPVPLVKYFTQYHTDPVAGVNTLTREIQSRLEKLTVNIQDEELEDFVRALERIYREELLAENAGRSAQDVAAFFLSQKIAEGVQYYQTHRPEVLAAIRDQVTSYQRKLARLHLRDELLRADNPARRAWHEYGRVALLALAGLPLALYGVINNYAPYHLAERAAKKFMDERTKILTALLFAGGLAFIFFYAVQTGIVAHYFGAWWASAYAVSLPLSGFWALSYLRRMRAARERLSFSFFWLTNKHLVNKLRLERKRLIKTLDAVRDEYLARRGAQ